MTSARELMSISPVIPVVTLEEPSAAVPVARALVEGGVRIIEVTLRTETAVESLRRIVSEVPEITAGAGTVLSPQQGEQALEAGAQFLVSPGLTTALLDWSEQLRTPLLGGVANLSQMMEAYDRGLSELKFFPAEAAGGAPYLKAAAGPLPGVTFCPTGGISTSNADSYLSLPNVGCVGGTWLTPQDAVREGRYDVVAQKAAEASQLGR